MRRIYLDLDGVFADFYRVAQAHLGVPYTELPPAEAWARLEKVRNLFRHLPLLPDALELWQGLQGKGLLHVLTASPQPTGELVTAPADKLAWVRQHLSPTIPVFVSASGVRKASFAAPGDILIDDLKRNIAAWEGAGGVGILHRSAAETLRELEQALALAA